MFISADRILGVSVAAAQSRLASLAEDGSLTRTSQAAYQDGIGDLVVRVGPLGARLGTSRLVRVQLLDPVYREDVMTVGMRWEAIGVTAGLFPVLDADISVSGRPGQPTRLAITGCYRPPFGALGSGLDRVVMHRVADLTLRAALTRLAASIEATGTLATGTATTGTATTAEPSPNGQPLACS